MNDLDKFTSTGAKYIHHPQMIESLRNGIGRPQSLQVALSNKCNLKCVFCSVAERELKQEWDYEELISVIHKFLLCGIGTIEFSGGGEPTLYPYFEELTTYCTIIGLHIGLITNGINLKNISYEILSKFDWIRISMVALDYHIKNGDVIEIITSKERKNPSRDWLKFVHTALAKSHIKRALKKDGIL